LIKNIRIFSTLFFIVPHSVLDILLLLTYTNEIVPIIKLKELPMGISLLIFFLLLRITFAYALVLVLGISRYASYAIILIAVPPLTTERIMGDIMGLENFLNEFVPDLSKFHPVAGILLLVLIEYSKLLLIILIKFIISK